MRGAATSRAEAQVLRLSAIYAALDSSVIGLPHLEAALAVWDYCYASASLFGMSTGDPIADRIREAIDASGGALSKSQIVRLFHGHMETDRIDAALETLIALGALGIQSERTGGRPSTRWAAIAADQHQENADSLAEDQGAGRSSIGLLSLLSLLSLFSHFFADAMKPGGVEGSAVLPQQPIFKKERGPNPLFIRSKRLAGSKWFCCCVPIPRHSAKDGAQNDRSVGRPA